MWTWRQSGRQKDRPPGSGGESVVWATKGKASGHGDKGTDLLAGALGATRSKRSAQKGLSICGWSVALKKGLSIYGWLILSAEAKRYCQLPNGPANGLRMRVRMCDILTRAGPASKRSAHLWVAHPPGGIREVPPFIFACPYTGPGHLCDWADHGTSQGAQWNGHAEGGRGEAVPLESCPGNAMGLVPGPGRRTSVGAANRRRPRWWPWQNGCSSPWQVRPLRFRLPVLRSARL